MSACDTEGWVLARLMVAAAAIILGIVVGCTQSHEYKPPAARFIAGELVKIQVSGQRGQVVGASWDWIEQYWVYEVRYASAIAKRDGWASKSTVNAVSYNTERFLAHELDNWKDKLGGRI